MVEQWPGGTPAELIDDLGHAIAERYRAIEDALYAKLVRLYEQHLEEPDNLILRYRAIQELREQAQNLVNTVPPEAIARLVTEEAATGASAAISRLVLSFPAYAARGAKQVTSLTQGGALAVAAAEFDLRDNLRALNSRILRLPVDAYQAMTAKHIGSLLTGITTNQALHRRILDEYLADGITGFTDKGGRRWTIGAYSEMATRTAASRAWGDQAQVSMQAHGINTFTPVIGNSACSKCGQWQGKILTDGGPTGDLMVAHAITGEPRVIHVDATLDEWRASGASHPNCRCVMVPGLPGGPKPADYSTWDPQKEKDRDKLRSLERDVREAKRNGTPDEIGEAQAALRDHVERTGITRRDYREQLPFADGGEKNPRGTTKPTGGPAVPDVPGPRIAGSGKYAAQLRTARESIAKVHSFPEAVGPEVRISKLPPGVQGRFTMPANHIAMSPEAISPRLTLAHEYGHHLDFVAGGGNMRKATSGALTGAWRDLFTAINASPETERLRRLLAAPELPTEAAKHIRYLLRRDELWARAYAQYIAEKSGDRTMRAGVQAWIDHRNPIVSSRQWKREGFAAISDAIDAVLREVGWLP